MYTPPRTKRVQDDDPITADDRNYLAAQIDSKTILVGPGLSADYRPQGTYIRLSNLVGNVIAQTSSGGIAARTGTTFPYTPGSAICELCYFDGAQIKDAGTTITVWNFTTAVVGASGNLILCKVVDGFYFVDTIDAC